MNSSVLSLLFVLSGVSSFSSSPHDSSTSRRRHQQHHDGATLSSSSSISMVKNNNNPFGISIGNPFAKTNKDDTTSQVPESKENIVVPVPTPAAPTPKKTSTSSQLLPFLESIGLGGSRKKDQDIVPSSPRPPPAPPSVIPDSSKRETSSTTTKKNKFDFIQRIESVKCAVIGAVTGSIAVAPVALIHYYASLPQLELVTDMAAVQGALFAIVYRYAIRTDDDNPMLNQGVLGAFVLVRTLPTIQTSPECSAIPLSCECPLSFYEGRNKVSHGMESIENSHALMTCSAFLFRTGGAPIGYFNWDMLNQAVVQGVESAALFGGVYLALEYAFSKGWISKFE
jgi:hypothetical protein